MDWITSKGLIEYQEALNRMESKVSKIINNERNETIWLLEHSDVYTAGTSANIKDLIEPKRFPVITTNRGGQFTYHGPGQRIVYLMIKLERFSFDVRKYVYFLEELVIRTLDDFSINTHRWEQAIGVWTHNDSTSDPEYRLDRYKIASIGIRVRRGVAFHGIAINMAPNIKNFDGITPCGLQDVRMTSVARQGMQINLSDFDESLKFNFDKLITVAAT